MAQESQVATLLLPFHTVITYHPLPTEVDYRAFVPEQAQVFEIPPQASLDPAAVAQQAIAFAGDTKTVLLVPGRKFDTAGTRHGQGGGWYDRFLTYVPRTWLRIGFCYDDQLSPTLLKREEWDQPVDYVVVKGREKETFTIYETSTVSDIVNS